MSAVAVAPCDDPALVARIHRDTVAVAYAEHFAGAAPPSVASFRSLWRRRLGEEDAVALVGSVNGEPAGVAATSGDGELLGLFVIPAFWSRGVGSALHDAALVALGNTEVTLWVIADNARARDFYERRGWRLQAGVVSEPYPGVPEVRYIHRGCPARAGHAPPASA